MMMLGIGSGENLDPEHPEHYGPSIHVFAQGWCGHCKRMKVDNNQFSSAMFDKAQSIKKGIIQPSPHTRINAPTEEIAIWCHEPGDDDQDDRRVAEGMGLK